MAKVKTTLNLDADLMRHVRVRAARSGRSQSDVLEEALREGLGVIDRLRHRNEGDEDEVLAVASEAVHDVRARDRSS